MNTTNTHLHFTFVIKLPNLYLSAMIKCGRDPLGINTNHMGEKHFECNVVKVVLIGHLYKLLLISTYHVAR